MGMDEAETCRQYVVPRLDAAGQDLAPHSYTGQDCFTGAVRMGRAAHGDRSAPRAIRKGPGAMRLEDYLDFLAPDVIRIKGHRIGLEQIVELFHEGYSAEQIQLELPTLSLEEVYATIAYYLHNRAPVDAYMARQLALVEEELRVAATREPSPAMKRIRALLAARQQARQSA